MFFNQRRISFCPLPLLYTFHKLQRDLKRGDKDLNPYNNFNGINNNNNPSNNSGPSLDNESTAAKLAVLGGFLATLGDAISTYAAVLALEEIQQSKSNNNKNNNGNNDDRINELEKQIKYLMKEINKQKKGIK